MSGTVHTSRVEAGCYRVFYDGEFVGELRRDGRHEHWTDGHWQLVPHQYLAPELVQGEVVCYFPWPVSSLDPEGHEALFGWHRTKTMALAEITAYLRDRHETIARLRTKRRGRAS